MQGSTVGAHPDRELIDAAQADHPGPTWLVADLAELDLAAAGEPEPFDAAVCAGNVMPFLAPGTEGIVLARIAAHLRDDGLVVVGFGLDRGYPWPTSTPRPRPPAWNSNTASLPGICAHGTTTHRSP